MFPHDTHCLIHEETHLILIPLVFPFWLYSQPLEKFNLGLKS